MDQFELQDYLEDYGYRVLGWKGNDVPPGYLFGPVLHL